MKIQFKIKSYYQPTPAKMRKIGDALLGASQFLTGYSIVMDEKWLAFTCIAIGTIGKFMTNFFVEEVEPQDKGYT
jgi:hypothetical protein